MKIILATLPILIIAFAFFICRFNGRRELMKMDLVQFIYAFVVTPAIIIWIKSVVFFNIDGVLRFMSSEEKFLVDSAITTLSLFVYAFVVMHSLTKSFAIKKSKDPLFDIFQHSEYFHVWLTHIVVYSCGIFLVFIPGIVNTYVPFEMLHDDSVLNIGVISGMVLGLLFYKILQTYKIDEEGKFFRLIKLQIYFYTFILVSTYTTQRLGFSPENAIFWCSITFFVSSTALSQLLRNE